MNKFDIKDGEYTSTIYGLIKVKSVLNEQEKETIEKISGATISRSHRHPHLHL